MILDPLGQVVARTTQVDNAPAMIVAALETDLARYVPPFERKNLRVSVQE